MMALDTEIIFFISTDDTNFH